MHETLCPSINYVEYRNETLQRGEHRYIANMCKMSVWHYSTSDIRSAE